MIRLVAILLAILVGAASAAPALAHAALVKSDPPDGALLPVAPTAIVLIFNEVVAPTALLLIDPAGGRRTLNGLQGSAGLIIAPAPAGMVGGTYAVSWRVVSEDGHPVAGTVLFSVGAPSADALGRAGIGDTPGILKAANWAARTLLYVGLFAGIGGAFFVAWMVPAGGLPVGARRAIAAALGAGIAAALLALGLQGLDLLGLGAGGLLRVATWKEALASAYGPTILVALAALGLALAALFEPGGRGARAASAAALLGVGVALSLSGHASTAPPRELMWAVVFFHTVPVTFWIGALLPLGWLLATRNRAAAPALRSFSATIPFALLPLVVAGVILALVQTEQIADLWTTAYGRLLSVKLILVIALFALALWNRRRLTAPALRGDPQARWRLARSIQAEIVLVVVVLGVVAGWRFTPPPRNLVPVEAVAAAGVTAPFFAHIHGLKSAANAIITPGAVGPVTVRVEPLTPELLPLDVLDVRVALSYPEAGIEPIRRAAVRQADGAWLADGFTLPLAGNWTVRVDLTISDFVAETLETPIVIRSRDTQPTAPTRPEPVELPLE